MEFYNAHEQLFKNNIDSSFQKKKELKVLAVFNITGL